MTAELHRLPEAEVVGRAQSGDPGARAELVRRELPHLKLWLRHLCRGARQVREVQQDAVVAALSALGGYRREAPFSAWLFVVARSACTRHRRHQAGDEELFGADPRRDADATDPALPPDAVVGGHELGQHLMRALAALPEEWAEAVALCDFSGLSCAEAALEMNVGVGALKSRLHRGRVALRTLLQADHPVEATG